MKYSTRKLWLCIWPHSILQNLLLIVDSHDFTLFSSPSPNDWEKGPASCNGYMTNSPVPGNTITCPWPKIFGDVLTPKEIFHYDLSSRYANNTTILTLQKTISYSGQHFLKKYHLHRKMKVAAMAWPWWHLVVKVPRDHRGSWLSRTVGTWNRFERCNRNVCCQKKRCATDYEVRSYHCI